MQFELGLKRRKIEDAIVAKFQQVNLQQKDRAWLEDQTFWDFIFSWYDLAKYYEDHQDTTLGAHMIELYMACVQMLQESAQDSRLKERRRDKAADALYQINYYVNQMMIHVDRNAADQEDAAGRIGWK